MVDDWKTREYLKPKSGECLSTSRSKDNEERKKCDRKTEMEDSPVHSNPSPDKYLAGVERFHGDRRKLVKIFHVFRKTSWSV